MPEKTKYQHTFCIPIDNNINLENAVYLLVELIKKQKEQLVEDSAVLDGLQQAQVKNILLFFDKSSTSSQDISNIRQQLTTHCNESDIDKFITFVSSPAWFKDSIDTLPEQFILSWIANHPNVITGRFINIVNQDIIINKEKIDKFLTDISFLLDKFKLGVWASTFLEERNYVIQDYYEPVLTVKLDFQNTSLTTNLSEIHWCNYITPDCWLIFDLEHNITKSNLIKPEKRFYCNIIKRYWYFYQYSANMFSAPNYFPTVTSEKDAYCLSSEKDRSKKKNKKKKKNVDADIMEIFKNGDDNIKKQLVDDKNLYKLLISNLNLKITKSDEDLNIVENILSFIFKSAVITV